MSAGPFPLRLGLLTLLVFALGIFQLDAPPLWWDEGWTLSVARTWVERGVYARQLLGEPVGTGLNASFWITGPVAGMFRLFGVGIWQGRLFGVLCTVAAVALLIVVARQLGTPRASWAVAVIAGLLTIHPQLNALVLGRQVLGEMPMLAALLAGCALLPAAIRGRIPAALLVCLAFALALAIKIQLAPFLLAGMLVALLILVRARSKRSIGMILAIGMGTLLCRPLLAWIAEQMIGQRTVRDYSGDVSGLTATMALVFTPENRVFALTVLVLFAWPTVLALTWALGRALRGRGMPAPLPERAVFWLLLTVAGTWATWFVTLSVGAPRYLFPAVFLATPLLANLIGTLTDDFDLHTTFRRIANLRVPQVAAPAWLALAIVVYSLPLTLVALRNEYLAVDRSAAAVAQLIARTTPPDAVIETYESEIHFLLDRSYHYPRDSVHVLLNRRSMLGERPEIGYDSLVANPDYLIVGRFAGDNDLYTPAIARGEFVAVERVGRYTIYLRQR